MSHNTGTGPLFCLSISGERDGARTQELVVAESSTHGTEMNRENRKLSQLDRNEFHCFKDIGLNELCLMDPELLGLYEN